MIQSIKQRLYLVGLLPLALLAVILVAVNGVARIQEAQEQLRESQSVMLELLRGAAIDALVIGNTQYFQDQINGAIQDSTRVRCVALWDLKNGV